MSENAVMLPVAVRTPVAAAPEFETTSLSAPFILKNIPEVAF